MESREPDEAPESLVLRRSGGGCDSARGRQNGCEAVRPGVCLDFGSLFAEDTSNPNSRRWMDAAGCFEMVRQQALLEAGR